MKKLALLFLFGFLASCFVPLGKVPQEDLLSNLSKEDRSQEPEIAVLPIGFLFVYVFSQELTERQCYYMAALVHDVSLDTLPVKKNDVIIFAYEGPERFVSVTMDYGNSEVEYWVGENGKDWYVKKLFKGNPSDILYYLVEGYEGNPEVTEGKITDEIRFLGKREEL